jgi:hypothetical protein
MLRFSANLKSQIKNLYHKNYLMQIPKRPIYEIAR